MPSDFLEKTLEEIIFENRHRIHERGFDKFYANAERQFRLPSGKIIDILTWEIKGDALYARIIELKKGAADEAAFWQGMDYLEEFAVTSYSEFSYFDISLTVCGDSISERLSNLFFINSSLSLYSYNYAYDGISFKAHLSPKDALQTYVREQMSNIPSTSPWMYRTQMCDYLREVDFKRIEKEINELKYKLK